jgi:hypothetical protein
MAEICEYFYTDGGLRFESGSGVVRLVIDGEERELRVVRNGKGKSRIEDGEITLRDLESHVQEEASLPVEFNLGGERVLLELDPRNAMGENGRGQSTRLSDVVAGLTEAQRGAVAKTQVESLPYGTKNSEEARERLRWALSQDTLTGVSREGLCSAAQFLDEEMTAQLLAKHPEMASALVFGLARGSADADLVVGVTPEARAVLAREGYLTMQGSVPALEGLGDETIADLREAGAVLDKTYGALVGAVPLSSWLLTRESLVTTSGNAWSLRTTTVRDENGGRVKDVSKLSPGSVVSVSPKWTKGENVGTRWFSVSETVGELVGVTTSEESFSDPALEAGWRSLGGALDVYSRLPGVTLRSAVGVLDDEELSQALAWSSPRDFAALSTFVRTAEHRSIAGRRFVSEINADAVTFGNALWNDPVDGGRSRHLDNESRASVKEREELRSAVMRELYEVGNLAEAAKRGMHLEELTNRAMRQAEVLVQHRNAAASAASTVMSVGGLRSDWFTEVLETVRHDDTLLSMVEAEGRYAASHASGEQRGLDEAADAIDYARKQLVRGAELARAGDSATSRIALFNAVRAVEEASQGVTRSVDSSTGLMEAMDYGAEERRTALRREDLRHERGLLAIAGAPLVTTAVAVAACGIVTGTIPKAPGVIIPLNMVAQHVRSKLRDKVGDSHLNRRLKSRDTA